MHALPRSVPLAGLSTVAIDPFKTGLLLPPSTRYRIPTHQLRAGDQTLTSPISPMHQPFPRARLAPPRYAQALVPSSLRSPPHEGALPPPRVPSPPIPPIRPPLMEQGISTDQLHQTIPRDRHRKKERKKNGGEMETIKRHRRCKDMKVS